MEKVFYLCSVELQQQGFKFNYQFFDYEKRGFIQQRAF